MARVILDHVWKRFGDVVAVHDMELEARDQEFLVLVGPSGCGKTTTLRMIAGLDEVTQGTITIGDREVNRLSPKDRDIAMVFQSYALYPHMSVFDNMAFGLKLRKMPKSEIRVRVNEAARTLNIENLLARKPKQLSGGQRQRVALGRAIVRHPAVFLMDEPLSNLDAQLRVQTRAEIIKLHQRLETTFVYVTHDQTEAMTMGDRIAVMSDGYLQQVDAPQTLYDFPANTFVAGFIGNPAMNLLPGEIIEREGKPYLLSDAYEIPLPAGLVRTAAGGGPSVLLGIRPEHVLLASRSQEPGAFRLHTVVDVVEHLGNEILAYLNLGGASLTARLDPGTAVAPGQPMAVVLDARALHLFDAGTGRAVSHGRIPVTEGV